MVKHNDDGSIVTYKDCPVVYIDNEIDIAFLKFPKKSDEITDAFEIDDVELSDGDEVWSAGFPGLLGRPGWQFAKGNITNRRAYIKELIDIKLSHIIQHSAPIDPGNSGGPLLIKDDSAPLGYRVIGINKWQVGSRQNTNFALPSTLIQKTIVKVKEAEKTAGDTQLLKDELERTCMILAAELNSDSPDWEEVKQFISYAFVGESGWDSFLTALNNSDEETRKSWENSFFNISPIETMRIALYIAFWRLIRKDSDSPDVAFVDINYSDIEKFGEITRIRTNFRVNDESVEIVWMYEFGHWRIHYTKLDPVLDPLSDEDQEQTLGSSTQGLYPFSFKGIKMFMFDLETENEKLHQKLLPDFQVLLKKRESAFAASIGVGVVGGIIGVVGLIILIEDINSWDYSTSSVDSMFILGTALFSSGTYLASFTRLIYVSLAPNKNDIIRFINTHNKYSDTPLNMLQ